MGMSTNQSFSLTKDDPNAIISGKCQRTRSRETMPASGISLIVMTGSSEGSEVERMVAQARQAITLDTVDKALTVEAIVAIGRALSNHY